jgi:RNA polymerase sigma-70 factor (ECF subfamily)
MQIDINSTVEGYLKTAVRNRVFNYIRSLNTKRKHVDNASRNGPGAEQPVDAQFREKELRSLYREEIEKLPDKMKEVYVLIKESQYSIAEVATHLDLSEQTVKNQLGTATKRIRAGLEKYKLLLWLLWLYLWV